MVLRTVRFLSTPSARRATHRGTKQAAAKSYFYPRPPRGGRLCGRLCADLEDLISIHALREEGDVAAVRIGGEATLFLSTPSARRATPQQQTLRGESNISIHALREEGDNSKQARRAAISISIHALREEGDQTSQVKKLHRHDFYPRPPRGGRRQSSKQICRQTDYFYPRPPRGGRQLIQSHDIHNL